MKIKNKILPAIIMTLSFTAGLSCAAEPAKTKAQSFYLQLGAYNKQDSVDIAKKLFAKNGVEAKQAKNVYGLICLYVKGYENYKAAVEEGKGLLREKKIKRFIVVPAKELALDPVLAKTVEETKEKQAEVSLETEQDNKIAKSQKASVNQEQMAQPQAGKTVVPECDRSSEELLKTQLATFQGKILRLETDLASARAANKVLQAEIDRLKASLSSNGYERLLELAESGDIAFLNKVGEVRIGAGFGKTVVRVPKASVGRADVLFERISSERIPGNGCVYYIIDSRFLNPK